MTGIIEIAPNFAVAGALRPGDFAAIARRGYRAIVSNLPDGELAGVPAAAEAAALAADAGLGFCHVPVRTLEVFSARARSDFCQALATLPPPILAHCASGHRAALLWASLAVGAHAPDRVLQRLRALGFDFLPLRAELEGLEPLPQTGPLPAALDLEPPGTGA